MSTIIQWPSRGCQTYNVALRNVGKGLGDVLGDEKGVRKLVEARLGGSLVRWRTHGLARWRRSEGGSINVIQSAEMVFVGEFIQRCRV